MIVMTASLAKVPSQIDFFPAQQITAIEDAQGRHFLLCRLTDAIETANGQALNEIVYLVWGYHADTVGFIRKLPTQLIESFKSTLDEVREADLLLHVVDISHINFEDHINSVNKILDEIESADKPTILVFNKIDAYTHQTIDEDDLVTERTKVHYTLDDWKNTWMNEMGESSLFISALNSENLEEFREKVFEEVKKVHMRRFPYNDYLYLEYDEEGNSI